MIKIKIYARNLEESALKQIEEFSNAPICDGSKIRIMPDAHSGKGCVIGTTMTINDKICPNIVGVDIGCGVLLAKMDVKWEEKLPELDDFIRRSIPHGFWNNKEKQDFDFTGLKCWTKLSENVRDSAEHSLGSLGGGNHFIEAYNDGYIAIHSGSRGIGNQVATYYQKLAIANNNHPNKELCYLEGQLKDDYLHDMKIIQQFADKNREKMMERIKNKFETSILSQINSVHNYIDFSLATPILRKGSISAQNGEELVIPLNMRDGMLICRGKGNEDWNYSSPHGCGRVHSRTSAKKELTMEQYQKSMEGIYTTCVSPKTLDECCFAYKDYKEIIELIEPTVDIIKHIKPIYNFKAQ